MRYHFKIWYTYKVTLSQPQENFIIISDPRKQWDEFFSELWKVKIYDIELDAYSESLCIYIYIYI